MAQEELTTDAGTETEEPMRLFKISTDENGMPEIRYPDGRVVEGVARIDIEPLLPMTPVRATLTVYADISDLEVQGRAVAHELPRPKSVHAQLREILSNLTATEIDELVRRDIALGYKAAQGNDSTPPGNEDLPPLTAEQEAKTP